MIEMFNAFNAISLNESLLTMTPFVNWYLIAATAGSTLLHCMIVYVPFFNQVFSIHAMTLEEWKLVMAFALPVILIEEVLKFGGRIYNARELEARLKKD
jgi:magnesium-transporting ATPase (P-type)